MINFLRNLFCSSLGKKYIMSITGFALFGFVVAHMIGNLQIFLGAEAINISQRVTNTPRIPSCALFVRKNFLNVKGGL